MADVRGGKPVKLAIKGEAVLPAVDIKESKLDFGEVYTGVAARIPITIINTTPVLAGQPLTCRPFSILPCYTAAVATACRSSLCASISVRCAALQAGWTDTVACAL